MPLFNAVISWFMKKRMHDISLFLEYPHEVQGDWFKKLLYSARDTEWGKKYDYRSITTPQQYSNRVPIHQYETLKPFIDRIRQGEQNILWPTDIKWFAKSSGTTSGKSKFIPVSQEALDECHFKGGKDLLSIYCNNNPETQIFTGKALGIGGSLYSDLPDVASFHGDVSAIIMENLPFWVELMRTPDISIALMDKWESKIEKIAQHTIHEDVTNLSGVPSWMLLLLHHILNITGKKNIEEIWPNIELYAHGGVNFSPYRDQYKLILPDTVRYLQTYNASEGFFGIQDMNEADDMLLMLDYGIYYEFLPLEQLACENPETLTLNQVETNTNYALIISTNAGLWRYLIGDTIRFTSLSPYRIQVTGRTKNFINAFGEELIIDNAERALEIACKKSNAILSEYTAAPIYFNHGENAAHEWLIEFTAPPDNLEYFIEVFDNALKAQNSDYEAKRYQNMILRKPVVKIVPHGTFYNWMKKRGKLGGQNKVPRLFNNRQYIDSIRELLLQSNIKEPLNTLIK